MDSNDFGNILLGFVVGVVVSFLVTGFLVSNSWRNTQQELKLKIAQGTYDCELYYEQVICYEVGE